MKLGSVYAFSPLLAYQPAGKKRADKDQPLHIDDQVIYREQIIKQHNPPIRNRKYCQKGCKISQQRKRAHQLYCALLFGLCLPGKGRHQHHDQRKRYQNKFGQSRRKSQLREFHNYPYPLAHHCLDRQLCCDLRHNIGHRIGHHIQQGRWIYPEPQNQNGQRHKNQHLAPVQPGHF